MSQAATPHAATPRDFRDGIQYFGQPWPGHAQHALRPAIGEASRKRRQDRARGARQPFAHPAVHLVPGEDGHGVRLD